MKNRQVTGLPTLIRSLAEYFFELDYCTEWRKIVPDAQRVFSYEDIEAQLRYLQEHPVPDTVEPDKKLVYIGAIGELKVLQRLMYLTDSMIFAGLQIQYFQGKRRRFKEIDSVLLNTAGVRSLEIKYWARNHVVYSDAQDPIAQAKAEKSALEQDIERQGFQDIPVQCSIIAAGTYVPENNDPEVSVLTLNQITYLENAQRIISLETVESLAEFFDNRIWIPRVI